MVLCGSTFITTGGAPPFSPADLPGLTLWFNPNDAPTVTQTAAPLIDGVNDKGPNGFHVTAAGAVRPDLVTVAGRTIIRSAAGERLDRTISSAIINNAAHCHVLAVVKFPVSPVTVVSACTLSSATGANARVQVGAGHTANFYHAGGRRLDADTFAKAVSAGGVTTTAYQLLEGIYNWAGALATVVIDGTSTPLNPFQTAGNTSNTNSASPSVAICSNGMDLVELVVVSGSIALAGTSLSDIRTYMTAIRDAMNA